jgi:hypothetical protein
MQFQSLLDLAEEVRYVEPLHTSIIQEVTGTQVDWLESEAVTSETNDNFVTFQLLKNHMIRDETN